MDMLELDLDMEADLGIDTVKQAETFQAIRSEFDIPRRDNLKLRDYPTLGAVIGFVRESRPVVGFRSLDVTRPWLVPAVAGVNEAGLAVIAQWPGAAAVDGDGAPPLLLVQDCLARFENVAGAADWCRKRPVEGRSSTTSGRHGADVTISFASRLVRAGVDLRTVPQPGRGGQRSCPRDCRARY